MIQIALLALVLQTAPTPTPPPPINCSDTDHSAFNFWIGAWDVTATGSETVLAQSTISPTAGGCAIEENYHQTLGPGGVTANYRGVSFSTFDAQGSGVWRQFYIDSAGSVTVFEGGIEDGAMVMRAPGRAGVVQRMTISPEADGSVRQLGESSSDAGATWTPVYDFRYRRR